MRRAAPHTRHIPHFWYCVCGGGGAAVDAPGGAAHEARAGEGSAPCTHGEPEAVLTDGSGPEATQQAAEEGPKTAARGYAQRALPRRRPPHLPDEHWVVRPRRHLPHDVAYAAANAAEGAAR
jgi:hypothetical protein